MGRPRVELCKVCGLPTDDPRGLSARKKCPGCGERAQIENVRQLVAHNGPYFDHWLRRIRASLGITLDGHR